MKTLKETQKALGLSQKEFGVYIGVSTRTINAWMSEGQPNTCPTYMVELISRIADADLKALEEGEPTTRFQRWAVISSDGGDEFLTVKGNQADALREAEMLWNHLTAKEKASLTTFQVGLVNVQLVEKHGHDGPFAYAEDGNGVIDADVYEVAKDFLAL